jgi:hypothetical protein
LGVQRWEDFLEWQNLVLKKAPKKGADRVDGWVSFSVSGINFFAKKCLKRPRQRNASATVRGNAKRKARLGIYSSPFTLSHGNPAAPKLF